MGEILKAAGCDYGNGKCCCDGCKQVIVFIQIEKKKKKNEVTLKKNQTHCLEHSVVTNSWKKQKESWIWIKK